jgi:aerobic carbon-monoxide dehydrogenase small subunit
MTQKVKVAITVNGTLHEREVEPRLLLSDFIRHDLGLKGTHVGCEHGLCGACTVLVDGHTARSCTLFTVMVDGSDIKTVESLGTMEEMHPIQEAFSEVHALQCGFCTPGFLMTTVEFLEGNPNPTAKEAREAIDGNFCRCTGYENIVEAVQLAAKKMAAH